MKASNNKNTANPGSQAAIENGCTCPVMDNYHGKGSGYYEDNGDVAFWLDDKCPLHGQEQTRPKT